MYLHNFVVDDRLGRLVESTISPCVIWRLKGHIVAPVDLSRGAGMQIRCGHCTFAEIIDATASHEPMRLEGCEGIVLFLSMRVKHGKLALMKYYSNKKALVRSIKSGPHRKSSKIVHRAAYVGLAISYAAVCWHSGELLSYGPVVAFYALLASLEK